MSSDRADGSFDIDSVIITAALDRRPSRPPDHEGENRALTTLAQAMSTDVDTVLQQLVTLAMALTGADSAGISLLEPGGEQDSFRWVATAGAWSAHRGAAISQPDSSCGIVIAQESVLLMQHPERVFPPLLHAGPGITEALLAPFHLHGVPMGTLWTVKHDPDAQFQAEDARLLKSLARFAAAAQQTIQALDAAKAVGRQAEVRAQQLVALTEISTEFIGTCDMAFMPTFGNVAAMQMVGLADLAQVKQTPLLDFFFPEDRAFITDEFFPRVLRDGKGKTEIRFRHFVTGEPIWVVYSLVVLHDETGQATGYGTVTHDITERKRTEVALRESEARERAVFTASPTPFLVVEPDAPRFTISRVNGAYLAATMTTRESLIGHGVFEVFPENLADPVNPGVIRLRASLERVIATRQSDELPVLKYDIARLDGSLEERWWSPINSPVLDENGDVEAIIHNANDITAQRRSDKALHELNATLESRVAVAVAERNRLWQNSLDLLTIGDGSLIAVNAAWTRALGWEQHELIGMPFVQLAHPDDAAETFAKFEAAAEQPLLEPHIYRMRHRNGAYRWISWTAAFDAGRVFGNGRDVTDERQREAAFALTQEALRQSQKMDAMGSLTGGVAHDFNNLLTPIVGTLDMLQRKGFGDAREQRLIAGAIQAADRAKTLVQRLLAFARRQPLQASAVDLGVLVREMAELIASTTGPQIKVVVDAAPGLPAAIADANQLEMAILNLAVNARDAMPGGGTLRIAVDTETVDDQHRADLPPGPYLRLSVADSGAGMDAATLGRAVEPFFSTKGVGKGTGLGLSMVHGLASQLGGALAIRSTPGVGTTIELWLPQSTERLATAQPAAAVPASVNASGTVLLVDDEDLVRLSTADMLIELGYRVVEAASAEAALTLVARGLKPDVLVTDHLMPGMSGTELARTLRTLRPTTRVLVVSGYAEAAGIAPDLPRLTKPFRNADLAASLAALN